MKNLIKKYLVLILLLTIPTLGFAQESSVLDKIIKSGELRVGTSGNQPPFSMKSKEGELMGYEIDLAKVLTETMKLKLTLVEKPFPELLEAIENNEVDVVMSGMTITPERNLKASFVGPYMLSGKSILAKTQRLKDLDEMTEINRPTIKVAVLKGSTSQKFVETLAPDVELTTVNDYDAAVKMILDNSVDLMVADYPVCLLSILRYPEAGLATLNAPMTIEPIGMALPPNTFQLNNLISNFLSALQLSGGLDLLEAKWFQDGSWLIRLP